MSMKSEIIISRKQREETKKLLQLLGEAAAVGAFACLAACTAPEQKPVAPVAQTTQRPAVKPAETPAETPTSAAKTVAGWEVTDFAGHGEVRAEGEQIILEIGAFLTGIHRANAPPKVNYEVTLEAMKLAGSDFFCGLTFPVGESFCSFIVGGWGGGVVGLSSIDGEDASS